MVLPQTSPKNELHFKNFSCGFLEGLYEDSVFIDMRKTFHAWVERSSLLGPGETKEDFKKEQARWLLRAVGKMKSNEPSIMLSQTR